MASGRVHDAVLVALLTVARTHRPSVSVVRSGHPLYVFGTTRRSDHPQGRAFDTWAVDGHPVVDPRTPRSAGRGLHARGRRGGVRQRRRPLPARCRRPSGSATTPTTTTSTPGSPADDAGRALPPTAAQVTGRLSYGVLSTIVVRVETFATDRIRAISPSSADGRRDPDLEDVGLVTRHRPARTRSPRCRAAARGSRRAGTGRSA